MSNLIHIPSNVSSWHIGADLNTKPILVICGQTATGKTALSVELARMFDGEVVSADSRQVYTGLNIGSAKVTKEEMQGVPHFGLDIANPITDTFSVADFQSYALTKIDEIHFKGKLPILAGGTHLYIESVLFEYDLPRIPPNKSLREELEALSLEALQKQLIEAVSSSENLDRFDLQNKRKVIRLLEIINHTGSLPDKVIKTPRYKALVVALTLPREELITRLEKRIIARVGGIQNEIKKLLNTGVTEEKLLSFGLEYRYGLQLLKQEISEEEFVATLTTKTWQFAKRQKTFLKRLREN